VTNTSDILAATAKDGASQWRDNAAFWVQIIQERRDRYRTELTDQAVFDAIGPCNGLTVLDAGCGEGYMSREIVRRGAKQVAGVDKSQPLIDAAMAAAPQQPGLSFKVADVVRLPFEAGTFDVVLANHLMNDLADITEPIQEFARVLTPAGRLVILMLHPCFYGHRAERQEIRRHLAVDEYYSPRAIEQHFEVDGIVSPVTTTSWVRPLESYTRALTAAGFHLADMREPHPSHEQMEASAWWRENFPRPLFLLLTAMKHA
jgi:2-polyprenyl-3-methyl-5-hydroxy-6-metoxy-1,4-benzoquinol methylase